MRMLIAAVGRLKPGPERELFAHYLSRAESLGRKLGLAPFAAVEIAEAKGASSSVRCRNEAQTLLAKVPQGYRLLSLDRSGSQLSSVDFAQLLAKYRDEGSPGVAFAIGGADGLGQEVLAATGRALSLGPMTLPHGLARIVLAEQIYRAETILAGHPYHRP